jgi:hypothetical protein
MTYLHTCPGNFLATVWRSFGRARARKWGQSMVLAMRLPSGVQRLRMIWVKQNGAERHRLK